MIGYLIATAIIAVVFLIPAWFSFRGEENEARRLLQASVAAGTREPATIQPWVDPTKCMGSGACVAVCPERDILKVIDGRATIVNGSSCVGHGACAAACPMDAIELRFGSERRGVEIPAVDENFQTNVPGMYVAGELGGMGLIANAVRQGTEALSYLSKSMPKADEDTLDLVIVGAGPAGIGASLAAKDAGLRHLVLEQDVLGGAITHFPRKKIVMAHGLNFPGRVKIPASTITKEALVELIQGLAQKEELPIAEKEPVLGVQRGDDGVFEVRTPTRTVRASKVLLAAGRRGTPRKLNVPGEDLPKVAYRLIDPEAVTHSHVLVVGGGDSALEAACSLAESSGNRVTVAHRSGNFSRAKARNRERIEALMARGKIRVRFDTTVRTIGRDRVVLNAGGGGVVLPNDEVYVFAGGVLPTAFLLAAGLRVERHFGGRVEVVEKTKR